jgi:hypothetical protein
MLLTLTLALGHFIQFHVTPPHGLDSSLFLGSCPEVSSLADFAYPL